VRRAPHTVWYVIVGLLGPVAAVASLLGLVAFSHGWLLGNRPGEGALYLLSVGVYSVACTVLLSCSHGHGRRFGAVAGLLFVMLGVVVGMLVLLGPTQHDPFG
jgi:hypothetical protein